MGVEEIMAIVGTVLVGVKMILMGVEKIAGVSPYEDVEEYASTARKYVVKALRVLNTIDMKPKGGKDA